MYPAILDLFTGKRTKSFFNFHSSLFGCFGKIMIGWPVLAIAKDVRTEPEYTTVKYAYDLSSVATGKTEYWSKNAFSLYPKPFSTQTFFNLIFFS